MVDNIRVVFAERTSVVDRPQASGTINLHLIAGQVVQIDNAGASLVYGGPIENSWFTGFLLVAD